MLSDDQLRRYARHIVLPEIGEAGQEKLARSHIAVVGAGGLGASALMSLAAGGIGRLTIIEPDHVELSNLPRQTLYETADIGRAKALAAKDRLEEMNPEINIATHQERLTADNARLLLQGVDMVMDGTDNYASRYIINDTCMGMNCPWVYGAMVGWKAQVSVFTSQPDQPCYRCFVPEIPERERSCAQEGIISPLAGMVGNMQALEAIKLLTGAGEPLSGKILLLDGLSMHARTTQLVRDEECGH